MKLSVVVQRDDEQRPRSLEIKRGRKKLKATYQYSNAGDVYGFTLEGRRDMLPSFGEIFQIVDAKRLDRIGTIELIDLITRIAEITTINVIESIGNIPNLTIMGSEGVALKQEAAGAGAWTDPDGFVASTWADEANAYDNNNNTYASATLTATGTESAFLELTFAAAVVANKIRFKAFRSHTTAKIDVDVKINGVWTHVFAGAFDNDTIIEKSFAQGSVDAVRIRFYKDKTTFSVALRVYEVDVWKVPTTGGYLEVKVIP